jgi:hypothetical protein
MNDDQPMSRLSEALAKLPREREPSAGLEDRTVGALWRRGLLGAKRAPVIELTSRWLISAAAAALLLVLGGFAAGWYLGTQNPWTSPVETPVDGFQLAATVQGTGGEYLAALMDLTTLSSLLDDEEVDQGREVALTTLASAASTVTRFVPREEVLRRLLPAIVQLDAGGITISGDLQVIPF